MEMYGLMRNQGVLNGGGASITLLPAMSFAKGFHSLPHTKCPAKSKVSKIPFIQKPLFILGSMRVGADSFIQGKERDQWPPLV